MTTTRTTMTPITITSRYGKQAWSATSKDGTWTYERDDTPGTPWIVTNTKKGQEAPYWFSTLKSARAWTYNH